VKVKKTNTATGSEWQILDEKYKQAFPGSEYFREQETTISLEANQRYFFSISLNGSENADSALYILYLGEEPVLLISSDIGPGDHFIPFFTGIRQEVTKITGGTSTTISEFPWQVYVVSGNLRCGGSIIAPNWIVTAAHCTKDDNGNNIPASQVSIKAGANNPFSSSEGTIYQASDVIPNETYNDVTLENDIALIKLKDAINVPNATPVKIVNQQDVSSGATDPGVMTWVTGWGLTHVSPNVFPTSLQKVQLPIVSNTQAATVWRNQITGTVLMAGFMNGNKDACSGDSGGPLVVPVLDEFKLAGIVSWGSSECNTYGAYTKISLYTDWIRSKTGLNPLFEPPAPTGDTIICKSQPSTVYHVSSVSGATSFEWKLIPSNAGSVSGSLTSATVTWNSNFFGSLSLAYRVTVNGQLSDWSSLKISHVKSTVFLGQSHDTTICADQPVTLFVNAEGYEINYQWFKDGVLVQSGSSSRYVLLAAGEGNSGDYHVEIAGFCGTVNSGPIHLTVLPLTNILSVSPDTDVPFGTDFTLNVNAAGHDLTYQWQKDSTLLPGVTGPSLPLTNVNASNIGLYKVIVKGTCGTRTSNRIYIYVTGQSYSGGPELFLWPSITNAEFNVAISTDDSYTVQIFNTLGQLLRTYSGLQYQNTINISFLPGGTYIIKVYNRNFSKTVKIIKT
jgi:V8-like Glu-specific endopeptidase